MAGEVSFIEIGVPDDHKARDFYENLFGWDFRMLSMGAAITLPNTATARVDAGMHVDTDPPQLYVYFAVPDLEAAMQRVRELGGTVGPLRPPSPEFGQFAECVDNQGVAFGLREVKPEE